MKKIGLFYGTATAKTAAVAKKIKEAFGEDIVDIIPVEQSDEKEFNAYEYIIAGSSTWFDGELPTYWDETLPELTGLDLTGKKVALFGLGDQKKYPDNFADGIGILAKGFTDRGATLVGRTSPENPEQAAGTITTTLCHRPYFRFTMRQHVFGHLQRIVFDKLRDRRTGQHLYCTV